MKRFFRKVFLLLFVGLLCFGAYLTTAGYAMYTKATADRSVTERVTALRQSEKYVALQDIPEIYQDAVVCTEDSRFYKHPGVDVISVVRAMYENIRSREFTQGGSTITQQVAKNLFFDNEKSLVRKVAELFVVYELEDNYAKDVILELYVNSVYYGDGYYCILDASKGYFRCHPRDMSDYECTLLAGIPNAPSVYAPTKNPDLAEQRQEHVLDRMVDCEAITPEQRAEILSERE